MNIKKFKKLITPLALGLALYLTTTLFRQSVSAQTAGGINIVLSPAKVNLTVEPGTSFTQTFSVGNYSGETKTFYVYVRDFTVINEDGAPRFFENENLDEEAKRFALSQWVNLPVESIVVNNNESVDIEATIDVPQDAEAGGHYGAFMVQTEEPSADGTAIGSIGRLAGMMLVNVPGDILEEVKITEAYTEKKIYWETNPKIRFITMLKNTGNVHAIPVGAFNIQGTTGAKNKSVIYNADQAAVLPGAPERKITNVFTLDQKGLVPPLGKFTIDLIARYGTQNYPLDTTVFFWMLPARFIAVSVLGSALVLFMLWRVLVSFKKK